MLTRGLLHFIPLLSVMLLADLAGAEAWRRPLSPETLPEADPATLLSEGLPDIRKDSGVHFESASGNRVRVLVQRKPKNFDHEFALLLVNGRIERAFLVSTAIEGKDPILGTYRLSVPEIEGKPWPWRTSAKYHHSPMYWALQIHGGYFIHSSPHYGNLGAPASMGCIRASLPDAMELFHAVANRSGSRTGTIILREGVDLSSDSAESKELSGALRDAGWSVERLKQALEENRQEIEAVSTGDLEYSPGVPAEAHFRPFADQFEAVKVFPTCGGSDCWKLYRRIPKILRLKPHVQFSNPESVDFRANVLPLALAPNSGTPSLDSLVNGGIGELDPFLIRDVRLTLTANGTGLKVRVCDPEAGVCSKPRGPEASFEGVFVYPMYQVSHRLKSSAGLILEVVSGEGMLLDATVRYFR
jgi:hypothetical protein